MQGIFNDRIKQMEYCEGYLQEIKRNGLFEAVGDINKDANKDDAEYQKLKATVGNIKTQIEKLISSALFIVNLYKSVRKGENALEIYIGNFGGPLENPLILAVDVAKRTMLQFTLFWKITPYKWKIYFINRMFFIIEACLKRYEEIHKYVYAVKEKFLTLLMAYDTGSGTEGTEQRNLAKQKLSKMPEIKLEHKFQEYERLWTNTKFFGENDNLVCI